MIDAMKSALETLEHVHRFDQKGLYGLDDEIDLLRQAIEQAEKEATLQEISDIGQEVEQEPVGEVLNIQWMSNTGGWLIGFHSKRRLYKGDKLYIEPMSTKPENIDTKTGCVDSVDIEPVAYKYTDKTNPLVFYFTDRKDVTPNPDVIETALYTAPPKREWVGLDDNEIQDTEHFCGDVFEFARAIEQRLKEKNI
jgi:hypothetical protein